MIGRNSASSYLRVKKKKKKKEIHLRQSSLIKSRIFFKNCYMALMPRTCGSRKLGELNEVPLHETAKGTFKQTWLTSLMTGSEQRRLLLPFQSLPEVSSNIYLSVSHTWTEPILHGFAHSIPSATESSRYHCNGCTLRSSTELLMSFPPGT